MRDSFFQFDNSTTAKFLRDGRKKFNNIDRNRAEKELFYMGTSIFGVINHLENSTNRPVTSDEPPKFTIDRYPRGA
jgi:hypothetical protein